MGNIGSSGVHGRRRHGSRRSHPQPEITASRYVFAAATPYPSQYANLNPSPLQYPEYYHPPARPAVPVPLPTLYDHHHRGDPAHWVGGRYPCGPMVPYVEHQKAVTIRNDVNLRKESLRLEPDEENPGRFLVAFTFDATVAGRRHNNYKFGSALDSINLLSESPEERNEKVAACHASTLRYWLKSLNEINVVKWGVIISDNRPFFSWNVLMKENLLQPVTVNFQQGLSQKFRQPSGTGIDFGMFEERELMKEGEMDVYPLAVKAEAYPPNQNGQDVNQLSGTVNSQITQAVFEKDKGEYQLRVGKQILWVNGMRYELQEIYGIGNSVEGDVDANDPGKECVICLSEPRDTTVLPCRHMCMCSGCAEVLRYQTKRCPICRQPVERLLEIRVNNGPDE
ncbi:hypothetical protein GH714_027932 [Hevea brasiliensis]|uniref:RING-type E3 ubiquitin transferase n=1 Tax=Hevea brasiliensis TaxID=3981 RepID=A0A6A6MIX9_HEVBR|nr:hypothetical protein GH714_027932 [Hevea brasiliensis]